MQQPASPGERFSPYFVVKNSGYVTANNVRFKCDDMGTYRRKPAASWPSDYFETEPVFEGADYAPIVMLKAGHQVARRCRVRQAPPGFERIEESALMAHIYYTSVLRPWTSLRAFMFELRRSDDGVWSWHFLQEGVSPAEARRLHRQGAPMMIPDPANHAMKDYEPEEQ